MAAPEAQMPFIKNLASSDRKLRASSVSSLRTFLSSRTALSTTEALKLWQGLFYALWMSDRVLAQQALCADLGGLVHVFPTAELASAWVRAFYTVMARRWTEIDGHRMNKFLLLVRRVLGASLARCAARGFAADEVAAAVGALRGDDGKGTDATAGRGPLTAGDDFGKVPVGFRMHVLDVWVDECDNAALLAREGGDEGGVALVRRIEGLVVEVQDAVGLVKPIKLRARESLADERLWWRREAEAETNADGDAVGGGGDDDSWGGFDD